MEKKKHKAQNTKKNQTLSIEHITTSDQTLPVERVKRSDFSVFVICDTFDFSIFLFSKHSKNLVDKRNVGRCVLNWIWLLEMLRF